LACGTGNAKIARSQGKRLKTLNGKRDFAEKDAEFVLCQEKKSTIGKKKRSTGTKWGREEGRIFRHGWLSQPTSQKEGTF